MSDKRIKVMQVVNGLRVGGAELKLLELINELDRNKFDITICSLEDIGSLKDDFLNTGYPLHILPRTVKFDFSLIGKLSRLMQQHKVDLVMTTLFYADVIGAFLYVCRGRHDRIRKEAGSANRGIFIPIARP